MPGLLKLLYRNSGLENVLRPPGVYEIKRLAKQADAMANPMGIQIDQLEWSLFMRRSLTIIFRFPLSTLFHTCNIAVICRFLEEKLQFGRS